MKYLNLIFLLIFIFSLSQTTSVQSSVSVKDITDRQHPRILLLKGEESLIREATAIHSNLMQKHLFDKISAPKVTEWKSQVPRR